MSRSKCEFKKTTEASQTSEEYKTGQKWQCVRCSECKPFWIQTAVFWVQNNYLKESVSVISKCPKTIHLKSKATVLNTKQLFQAQNRDINFKQFKFRPLVRNYVDLIHTSKEFDALRGSVGKKDKSLLSGSWEFIASYASQLGIKLIHKVDN